MASHPEKIGKYTVEGVLGRGGMGVVYKAVDRQIGRFVAIKMITAGGDDSLFGRFTQEAKSMGQLTCPNIVTVFDFGEQDGNPYLVMQFLEGSSLESLIQKGISLTLAERLGIIIDVCNGLAYAHQRGVIHRDVKPGNIMVLQDGVNDGTAVIVDFGIAKIGGDTRITRTDQIIGSFHYMAAEQFRQEEPDNRTDVYAVGVVLFQILTGKLPFDAPDTAAMMYQILNEPPPPLSKYIKDYPVELEAIVSRALAKKREERYAGARDLVFDLMQVQERLKSETVAQLFQRAEVSLRREEWTRAREHLQQVLRLDRQNTHAQKLMNSVQERLRHLQQIEQARALRSQADEAYLDQRYDDALRLLERAVALDGNNTNLVSFRDSVRSAKERATGLRRALRRAEAALQDGDLDEAQNAVSEAFKIDPQDTQAKALKVVIAQQAEEKLRQEQLRKLLDEVRNLIAARHLTAAFNILKSAEALDPTSNELQTVAKLAVAAREQEKRRAEIEALRQQIEIALSQEDYTTAVAKADEGLRRFPQEQSLLKLKALVDAQRLRVEQKKFIREQFSAASSLADSGELSQAVIVLERALRRAPGNSELESLRSSFLDRLATEEAGQRRQRAVENTIAEGERILQERGARDATEFLAARAHEYSDSSQFRDLYDSVRERGALDALDSRLASEPHPARQVQLGEEALRYNPNNRWIQQRVADLQRVKAQVTAAVERAEGFEAAGRLADALREWQQLFGAYPQLREFEAQVRRVASLQAESRKSRIVPPAPAPPVPPVAAPETSKTAESIEGISATQVLNSGVLQPDVARTRTTSTAPKPGVKPPPLTIDPRTSPRIPRTEPAPFERGRQSESPVGGSKKYIAIGVSVVVLVVAYLIFGGGKKTVLVSIDTNPTGANVAVGTQKCQTPCQLRLRPGKQELNTEREGYQARSESVTVAEDTKSLPTIALKPIELPPPPRPPAPPEQGILIVRSNAEDAEVFVDGVQQGVIKHNRYEGKFDVGSHQVTLRKPRYKDSQPQNVEIAKGVPWIAKIPSLEQGESELGYVVITTNVGATIAIDDKVLDGRVPREGHRTQPVLPGKHSIQIHLDGYDPYNGEADVKLGQKFSINKILNPKPTVRPSTPQPTIVSFTPNQPSVVQGQSVQLSWKTENAVEVLIDGVQVDTSGSKPVTPTVNTTYTLTAKGQGGTASSQATVIVKSIEYPPVAILFNAAPLSIHEGESTTLSWKTQNAVSVSIDQVQDKVDVNGSAIVKPAQGTKYILRATGQGGDVKTESVTIEVKAAEAKAAEAKSDRSTPSSSDEKECLSRFKEAYESLDSSVLRKVWTSFDDKHRKAYEQTVKSAQAIRLQENQCTEPSSSEDTIHFQCSETSTYTMDRKQQKPTRPLTVEFVCKKATDGWVVASRIPK